MTNQRVTIYLFQAGVDIDAAIDDREAVQRIDVSTQLGSGATLLLLKSAEKRPTWVDYVQPLTDVPLGDRVTTSSASGALVFTTGDRTFALTFGYGRKLVNLDKIEHGFGRRVALNTIDPSAMRSLDTKTFEDMVVTRSVQSSKKTELPTFGVDVSRDILRGVTGKPTDETIGKTLSGADALVINPPSGAKDLPSYCGVLLGKFSSPDYLENFSWVDQLAPVDDKGAIASLDQVLVANLQSRDTSDTHLSMPDALDWGDIDHFSITGTRGYEYDDLDLDLYLENLGDGAREITLDLLRNRRVAVTYSRSGQEDDRWPLYRCLVSEVRQNGKLYVLSEGRWFRVEESLSSEVDQYVNQIPRSSLNLIGANVNEEEGAYNKRCAEMNPGNLLCLDAKIKRPGGASSGIEVCDLFSRDGDFIHVKKRSRSATLSHLFAQGRISASTFLQDGVFRDRIREHVSQNTPSDPQGWLKLIPDGKSPVRSADYAVSYVVIIKDARIDGNWLPFFSKLNLMQTARTLNSMGFKVNLTPLSLTTG